MLSIPLPNPSGLCLCGCGQPTTVAKQNSTLYGWVKGQHTRFCVGHGVKNRRGMADKVPPFADAFWKRVEKGPGCWLWTGPLDQDGYGRFSHHKIIYKSHRVSWELTNGPIPEGMIICHDCDKDYPLGDITYRRCVRPDHTFLGTDTANMADRDAKGRGARGSQLSPLVEAQVLEIRRLYGLGEWSQDSLAALFHVSDGTISNIVTRKTWVHI